MTTEYQAAMAKFAADTKIACATSVDITKAAAAKAAVKAAKATKAADVAAARAAQAAKVAKTAKTASITKAAYATGKPATKGFAFHAKAALLTHPYLFSLAGGVIVGIVAYRLVNKYWLNKKDDTVKS